MTCEMYYMYVKNNKIFNRDSPLSLAVFHIARKNVKNTSSLANFLHFGMSQHRTNSNINVFLSMAQMEFIQNTGINISAHFHNISFHTECCTERGLNLISICVHTLQSHSEQKRERMIGDDEDDNNMFRFTIATSLAAATS